MAHPGNKFRLALAGESPLQIVGVIHAYAARMAEQAGFLALYLSGAGVANASFALPDLGMTSLCEVLEDARRITGSCDLPLLVDVDTGWGGSFNISRTIREMERAGVAAVHLEDQVSQKRCGHRPGKQLVSCAEMVERIKSAVDGRRDRSFFIMARTDAYAGEGLEACLERCSRYIEAGADGIFAEAVTDGTDYKAFRKKLKVPILANMTEFGRTELFDTKQLAKWGVDMVLYPLSAFRAMNKAAEMVYRTIRRDGQQRAVLEELQTREELYAYLKYKEYEEKLDELFSKDV